MGLQGPGAKEACKKDDEATAGASKDSTPCGNAAIKVASSGKEEQQKTENEPFAQNGHDRDANQRNAEDVAVDNTEGRKRDDRSRSRGKAENGPDSKDRAQAEK